jgi:hypothetical protein
MSAHPASCTAAWEIGGVVGYQLHPPVIPVDSVLLFQICDVCGITRQQTGTVVQLTIQQRALLLLLCLPSCFCCCPAG